MFIRNVRMMVVNRIDRACHVYDYLLTLFTNIREELECVLPDNIYEISN